MQKIVIDTNVIVSALTGSGYPTQIIFDLVLGKKAIVCSSLEVFAEYIEVLHREKFAKYSRFLTNAEIVLNKMDELSLKFIPSEKLHVIDDESDNKFLELAVTAKADFLISGNTHHFEMKEYGDIKIVTPEEYINQYFR